MKFSKKGYLSNSPDVNKPQNIIKGGNITMEGVDFKVHGIDNNGYAKIMTPGYDAIFPNAKYVTETPIKNKNMGSFKLRHGKGNMPKTGRSIPFQMTGPLHQEDQVEIKTGSKNLNKKNVRKDIKKIVNAVTTQDANVNFYSESGSGTKIKINKGNDLVKVTRHKGGLKLDNISSSDQNLSNVNKRQLKKNIKNAIKEGKGVSIKDGVVSTYQPTRLKTEREKDLDKRRAELEAKRQERRKTNLENRNKKREQTSKTKEQILAERKQKITQIKAKKDAERKQKLEKIKDEKSGK